jgi:hypothetical protein
MIRGWICYLQLLTVLASAIILGQSAAGFMTIFYYLKFVTSNFKVQVATFISLRNMLTQLYPRHWVQFSSPMICREVFKPASTSSQVILRPTVGRLVLLITFWHRPHKKTLPVAV